MTQSQMVQPPKIKLKTAKKEIGFGMPPSFFGPDAAKALAAILAAPTTRGIIVESASWTVDIPLRDIDVASTFGKSFDVFGTKNGQPPAGVVDSTNTLSVPGVPSSDMVILGIRVRCLVEPQSRLIRGNAFDPTGMAHPPGSPDVFTQNDFTNNVLIASGEQSPSPAGAGYLPSEFLWGTPAWEVAGGFMRAYSLNWRMDEQESLIKEPLLEVGTIQPFSEAMGFGSSFTSNIDRVRSLNDRLSTLGLVPPQVFEPVSHKRLGSISSEAGPPAVNVGQFTVSREEDGSPTAFGGTGIPQDSNDKSPLIFVVPVYWPLGQPLGITFDLNSEVNQATMQRWLSVTGGTNGQAGQDLNLPFSSIAGMAGFTGTGDDIMEELTLDPTQISVSQGMQMNRNLQKGGRVIFQVGLIGVRIGQAWKSTVYQAILSGAIQAPMGYGALPSA